MSIDLDGAQAGSTEYIARMALELSRMAVRANRPVLAYLLDMAAEEAGPEGTVADEPAHPSESPDRQPRRPPIPA
jgi:hypothetical protein